MDSSLYLEGAALSELVSFCGQYVAVGVGVALIMWMLGYAIWLVIDLVRGGI